MMKQFITLILCFIFIIPSLFAQDDREQILAKNNIYKKIIRGEEYKGRKLIKTSHIEETYDTLGRTVDFIVFREDGSIKHTHISSYSKDGYSELREQFDDKGELIHAFSTVRDPIKNTTTKVQTNPEKDTLVHQIRLKDADNKDSILYRIIDGNKTVQIKYEYDEDGNRTDQRYTLKGLLADITKDTIGNCIITRDSESEIIDKVCEDDLTRTIHCYKDRVGYLFGLTLTREKGGRVVITDNEFGLIKSRIHYSKRGKIFAKLSFGYLNEK